MIRRATEADLPEMRRVFDAARAYMAAIADGLVLAYEIKCLMPRARIWQRRAI